MRYASVLRLVLLALAGIALAWGVYAVLCYGWRDLYADQWRLYRQFLALSFPDNVLFLENGHRPVIPNLIRVAEIAWFRGSQWMQWAVGIAFAIATVLMGWRTVFRDHAIDGLSQAACAVALALAVFWLANSRMLMHPNESVHTYLITLMVALAGAVGARLAHGARGIGPEIVVGSTCCLVATFSFGPGVALFVALGLSLVIARARWGNVVFLMVALVVTLAAYFALPGAEGVSGVLQVRPLDNARVAAQWLSSPIMYVLLPFLDRGYAGALPFEFLRQFAGWTSGAYTARFGEVWNSVGPQAAVGAMGIAALFLQSINCWRQVSMTPTRFSGLVFAWFGLGVAGVVSLSRLAYFDVHPGQVYANRYLPWPCLFWAGLVLVTLGRPRKDATAAREKAHLWVVAAVTFFAVAAVASNSSGMQWSRFTQALIRHQASAVLTDVYSASLYQGETLPDEVKAGLPLVRDARIAMFAHPAAGRLGMRLDGLPADFGPEAVQASAKSFVSDVGVVALEIAATLPAGYPHTRVEYWVLTDESGVVVGYAHADPLDSTTRIAGFVRADRSRDSVRAYPWPDKGGPGPGVTLRLAAAPPR